MREFATVHSGSRCLRGMIHIPDEGTPTAVVCMFAGPYSTHAGPHRLFVSLAEELEGQGVASVRYNLAGQGDSDGEYMDISPELQAGDGWAIIDSVLTDERFGDAEVIVLGFDVGALLAATLAKLVPGQISRVVLLSPAINHPRIMEQLLQSVPGNTDLIDMGGVAVTRTSCLQAANLDVNELFASVQSQMLMVTASGDQLTPRSQIRALMQGALRDGCQHVEIDRADHAFSHFQLRKGVVDVVTRFILQTSHAGANASRTTPLGS